MRAIVHVKLYSSRKGIPSYLRKPSFFPLPGPQKAPCAGAYVNNAVCMRQLILLDFLQIFIF